MICFSKNEQLMSALAGWKGLVRMICFSKNEDRAKLFTQRMDFNISCTPDFILFNEKIGRIQMIFDIEN